jgi:hypothetical protein
MRPDRRQNLASGWRILLLDWLLLAMRGLASAKMRLSSSLIRFLVWGIGFPALTSVSQR